MRPPTGQIIEHRGKDGLTYRSLRLQVNGERRSMSLGPVSEDEAARERARVLRAALSGRWVGPARLDAAERSRLQAARRAQLAENRRTASEAYALVRRALQALDTASAGAGSPTARRQYRDAWILLDEAATKIDRGIRDEPYTR